MTRSTKRLWEKGMPLDKMLHRFTVGDDPAWDRHLVHWDCLGSAVHALTLARCGLLSEDELASLLTGLAEIDAQALRSEFEIPEELEDCHTAIEAALTRMCGDAGAKIHAGRSRNDQIATSMRLFLRRRTVMLLESLGQFIDTLTQRARRDGDVPMPGYTHLRRAMPSSVGQWLHSFAEAALEQMRAGFDLLDRLDASPLGVGAGYGVPLPLDRANAAGLLGFRRVQRSPIDVQNSRGRYEIYFLRAAADATAVVEKLSCDLILFSTPEFGFFELPDEMTTGSSIMPQKKNPDVLELLRAHAVRIRARLFELEGIAAKLTSGYHRDMQLTKEPAIRTALELDDMLRVAERVIAGFTIRRKRLDAAMRPELYATHAALALVEEGMAFRDAYRSVSAEIAANEFDDQRVARWRGVGGLVEPSVWAETRAETEELRERAENERRRIEAIETALLPLEHS